LTKIMAVEWAVHGVRVNAVSPGPTETAMALSVYDTEQKLNRRKKAIPMNRFARPDEIAKAVLFLSSDESGYVTGDSLVIDGGSLNSMYHLVGLMPEAG
jgi:3-oxoacyl-[acyl-carrier protein] reductase